MFTAAGIPFIAPADSARAVASVYTASLLVTVPLIAAGVGFFALRRASAEARVLLLRSAIVALLLVLIGRHLPLQLMAWGIPSTLATPLVALGRAQVNGAPELRETTASIVDMIFVAYVLGAAIVIVPTLLATLKMRRIARRARVLDTADWQSVLREATDSFGVSAGVRLVATSEVGVPMTWGWRRPVIALPLASDSWSDEERRIVIRHEVAHIAARDWLFAIVARAVCAAYWFHPGAWWLSRALRDECEHASDDRVIASGVRRSDYAEVLMDAAERLLAPEAALALASKRGLRGRLVAILDTNRVAVPVARGWIAVAGLSTVLVAAPMSTVQLAPSRDVLTTLMRDSRWESRAYAVVRLAQRPDSVAIARVAAEQDPNPRVRAWARYALRQGSADQLRALLHQ